MSTASSKLAIRPERCDRCGKCVVACPRSLVKVGGGYIYIDVAKCQNCFSCVGACSRGAIERSGTPKRPVASHVPGAKVVVGSRAEAKAYKKAAQTAEKNRTVIHKRPTGAAAATSTSATGAPGSRWAAVFRRSQAPAARAQAASSRPGMSWTPIEVTALAVIAAVAFVLKQLALSSAVFTLMPASGQVVARSAILGAYYGVQIAAIVYAAHRRGFTLATAFPPSSSSSTPGGRFANAGLVILLLLGTRAFTTAWAAIMRGLGWTPPVVADAEFSALFGAGVAGLALTLVAVAVIGPIAEELFFRGAFLRMLAERMEAWPAVLITALLYAGSHLEPWVLVSTFVLGMALGWLAWMRGSIRSAIVLHGLYNASAVLAAYFVAL